MRKTGIAVIGAGPGGYVAALRAAQLGADVVLIEKQRVGGVCLNVGCIPTKALLKSAEVFSLAQKAGDFGVMLEQPRIDWPAILRRKQKVVDQLVGGVELLLNRADVKLIEGDAHFLAADTLEVASKDGLQRIAADRIVIATGSRNAELPIPGMDLPGVIDSTAALSLEKLPESIAIIGGGAIGLEWASMFADFGSRVTLVEMMPRLAPLMDQDLGEALAFNLAKRGVAVLTDTAVLGIASKQDGLHTLVKTPEGESVVASEKVLSAVGRVPNVEGLGLEKAEVDYHRGGIVVDHRMRTSTAGVYAIGDVALDGPMLAHVASHQGLVAVEDALGHSVSMDYSAVPSCIFTRPEAASVGLSEAEARQAQQVVKVGRFGLANNGKAIANGETEGFVKIVAGENEKEILGVHIFGAHASDLVLEGTLARRLDATLDDLAATVHPHPTLGEALMESVLAASDQALHVPRSSA